MKKLLLFFLTWLIGTAIYPQGTASFGKAGNDPAIDQSMFVAGEILIRFKDEVQVSLLKQGGQVQTGIPTIDRLFQKYQVRSNEKLFPNEIRRANKVMLRSGNGQEFERPNLHNMYKLKVGEASRLFEAIEDLQKDPNIIYAEPNYILSITNAQPVSAVMSSPPSTITIPNDPLYSQQWGIPAIHADAVWDSVAGRDSTQVIGILDTGVDWLHPDLVNKIWVNADEIPGNGIDDDGNGRIDDVRGWDFINNDNNPADDNSHGTHCAGIAAAQSNNGIGISGVSPGARIMPIKVFQSSGTGDVATISQGITYAANNGATVLSMSFGTYLESLTMKSALANAYATAVMVAAGGNDGLCIGPGPCADLRDGAPLYPGAFSFVLGVEATKQTVDNCGIRACFTNYDQDGPVFSAYSDLLNYELKAPGEGILSCVPGGNYRVYSGTSMATPLVAGAIALYRTLRPGESIEILFGNLINSSGDHLNIEAAINATPIPVLNIVTYSIADTLGGDRDGRVDAGETIEFRVMVRNTWGLTDSVKVGIAFHEFEDTTSATILTREAMVGSISAYANLYNAVPLKVHFTPGLNDGRSIVFDLTTWYDNHQGEDTRQIVISVENGVELSGIISSDLTLYPDRQYIVTEHLAILQGVTLTIKPGTTLKFAEGKSMMVAGTVNSLGTKDSLITFTKRDLGGKWKSLETTDGSTFHATYTVFKHAGYNAIWRMFNFPSPDLILKNCRFTENEGGGGIWFSGGAIVEQSCFYNNRFSYRGIQSLYSSPNQGIENNNIVMNLNDGSPSDGGAISTYVYDFHFKKNNIFSNTNTVLNKEINISSATFGFNIFILDSMYYGTTNEGKINSGIYDYQERGEGILFDISKKLNRPLSQAHGIVWKVEVNGKDAQDDFELLDPLGIGQHIFKVWFNRAMDIQFPPMVSMGARLPYTQTAIAENGSWSADSTTYTVYGTVGLSTGDGINTIRVTGAKDTDHFEIPNEDRRFRVIVNGAGSLSAGFMATPGMGKVMLQWENPPEGVSDLLGYNMYRYTYINNTVTSDTILINPVLITDTVFTDFDVEPGTPYFYAYKTVRTNLSESDLSQVVTAAPLTASTGDANGDMAVNVLDVTTIISYMTNQNPQPFIYEAADVNNDTTINVLDVVGVVNIITGKKKGVYTENPPAYIYLERGSIQFKTTQQVAGLQFEIEGNDLDQIRLHTKLSGYELATGIFNGKLIGILYSYNNTLPLGLQQIIEIEGPTDQLRWGELLACDSQGNPVKVIPDQLHSWSLSDCGLRVYPNPFGQSVSIVYELFESAQIKVEVLDFYGRTISEVYSGMQPRGTFINVWNGTDNNGHVSTAGVYLIKMTVSGNSGEQTYKYAKVIKIK